MTIGWIFPKNNNGPITGIGEAGVETFKGSPFNSLAREICQNSLDARLNNGQPVFVEFHEFNISQEQLMSAGELIDAFERSRDFWENLNNKKTVEFFEKALDIVNSDEIPVLRISDFNTTGLTGSNKEYGTPWYNLVKSSGVSDKGASSGGSFGIGKSAPYACSDLRTIYYSTLDHNGLQASQGVSRLVTFRDSDGDTTYGTGYYGNKEDVSPLKKPLFLDNKYTRINSGTDIYILGFQDDNGWQNEMIKAVIEGYLIAIHEDKLRVIVGDVQISKDTLPSLIETYKDNFKYAYNYYQVLTSEETQEFTYEMEGLGKFELKILLKQGLHRKILVTRINGMKLFDKANISSTIQFAGILRLIDEPVNEFFRLLEPPEHNAWEPERATSKTLAKNRIREINRFMKNTVIELGMIPSSDEVDAEGVGEYLPDDISLLDDNNYVKENDESTKMEKQSINIDSKERPIDSSGFNNDGVKDIDEEITTTGSEDDEGNLSQEGSQEEADDTTDDKTDEEKNYIDDDQGDKDVRKTITVRTSNVRLFLLDRSLKKYRILFTTEDTFKEGYIQVYIASEDGRLKAKLKEAFIEKKKKVRIKKNDNKGFLSKLVSRSSNEIVEETIEKDLPIEDNKILIKNIVAKQKNKLSFVLEYDEACSLEVKFYGYKE